MPKEQKTRFQKMEERLSYKRESAWKSFDKKTHDKIFSFSDDYKRFLGDSKTERKSSDNIKSLLEKKGFRNIDDVKKAKTGDKLYKQVKAKTLIAFIVGKRKNDLRIIGSHIDSPRLDLKPFPLAEDSGLATIKTHYYGGIKKYHWVNHPLEIHGVAHTANGKKVDISIGDSDDDPRFIISDLLPHLARKQMEKTPKEVVEGEELKLLAGNIPVDDENIKNKVKLMVMKKLEEEHGIKEEDLCFAELEAVPNTNPIDIGLDRSMVAGYGHDDRSCAYTSLRALLSLKNAGSTPVAFFADKEEIGSVGNTGADSMILNNFAHDYCKMTGIDTAPASLLENAKAISADVTAGVNPNHQDVHDLQNASFIGFGVSVEKYGGAGGKYSTNDTHAEYMSFMRNILNKNAIPWQTGELGKVDMGGGGTIGMFMSKFGMDCVDIGPCALGMHSPCEVMSKADIYAAYLLYKHFFSS
ncbi:MAG: aminopeptidase [Candidatus Woesearchaeota archaeon]